MSPITTHVLDLALGRPAAAVPVRLETRGLDGWTLVGSGQTDDDGRIRNLLPDSTTLAAGTHYRLTFDTGAYFAGQSRESFYPEVVVTFVVRDPKHHHVPVLLSPFGYSTYRGS
ncbi:MAG: hydroxyisourate hydrolase [Deltaproteobacteria bacterium]|nr:hydroxyisourate hydrolase [Deltaproteobacteria bacterium]